MSAAKHTPGLRARPMPGRLKPIHLVTSDNEIVATVHRRAGYEATAHVFSTAPELLEALIRLVASFAMCVTCNGSGIRLSQKAEGCRKCCGLGLLPSGGTAEALEMSRAAIAKARGEK